MPTTHAENTASETVREYLATMEARDLAKASEFLTEDFQMTFPGDVTFTTPQELAKWGAERYRFVKKTYKGFDEMQSESMAVVYCYGTLNGERPDGTQFSGIRFIDRFEVKDGLLQDQRVWNDLAESQS
jgi:ketosteroid isomerase-like protein